MFAQRHLSIDAEGALNHDAKCSQVDVVPAPSLTQKTNTWQQKPQHAHERVMGSFTYDSNKQDPDPNWTH
eukprot:6173809-Pleurochrysis_carterae.AAC.2